MVLKIIKKIFKKLFVKNNIQNIKEYNTYEDALNDCSTQKAYENIELCCMIADKTINYEKILKDKPYLIKSSNVFLLNAIQLHLLENCKKNITILDFGGACGAHYFETVNLFNNNYNVKWIVVETSEMVKSAKNHGIEDGNLVFIDNMEKINEFIDLIYCSGALQYVSNWKLFLNNLIDIKAKYILFNRMMFNENDRTFITIQKSKLFDNGPGLMPNNYVNKDIYYPHTTISKNEFMNTMTEKDYNLEWIFNENSGKININNEKIVGMGLFYKTNIGTSLNKR